MNSRDINRSDLSIHRECRKMAGRRHRWRVRSFVCDRRKSRKPSWSRKHTPPSQPVEGENKETEPPRVMRIPDL